MLMLQRKYYIAFLTFFTVFVLFTWSWNRSCSQSYFTYCYTLLCSMDNLSVYEIYALCFCFCCLTDVICRDQPNSREKMHDFTAEFLKCVKFHGKFTERVLEIHGPHRHYFEALR